MEIQSKLMQKDVVCPLMAEAGYHNLKINICDKHSWEIRKKYPIMFDCCEGGNCIRLEEGTRVPSLECDYRNDCQLGQQCNKSDENCTWALVLKHKRVRDIFIAKITRKIPAFTNPEKARQIIEEKLLAAWL